MGSGEITTKELEVQLKEKNHIIVIDVREDEEVKLGMIENAKHIPLQSIPNHLDELNKDKHYVVVCRSGARSGLVTTYLLEQGFKASNMVGGMLDWQGKTV